MNDPRTNFRNAQCCATCDHYEEFPYEGCGDCLLTKDDDGYTHVVYEYTICDQYTSPEEPA